MASNYPAGTDTLVNPVSTDITSVVDHALNHTNANNAVMAVESNMGTNSGTNIHKSFVAGNFPVRQNSSNVFQNTMQGTLTASSVAGTLNTTAGTVTGAVIGTNTVQGGTFAGQIINGGTIANGVIGTATIQGGTANAITLGTPTISPSISPVLASTTITTSGTTASTSFVALVGGTVVLTTNVISNVMVQFSGEWFNGGVQANFMALVKNGTILAQNTDQQDTAAAPHMITMTYFDTNVPAGFVGTYSIQFKVGNGTATIVGGNVGNENSRFYAIAYPV